MCGSSSLVAYYVYTESRWEDVYAYLGTYGFAAAGGRLGPVCVPGLLLAGGVNFYGNQVGWSCNTVINYEIVLAEGSVVQANKTHSSDLFWALKGGSSNFDIVTRFDLEIIKSPKVWLAPTPFPRNTWINSSRHETINTWNGLLANNIQAAATYASNISDPKTHIVPVLVPGDEPLTSVILFYDSEDTSYSEIFKPFYRHSCYKQHP
ncbi:hypothetical protein BDV23DRAFT_187672 [Aspergillus alliaceus]|uniref:FAD-binding PCMH-type domain-containing protein n=1 Tax=Petromyces alliaceus TaxID=209559 RepID=A0A5N7BW81_PETAA|nr:hypothetical protein BDV23DRAFT_187672 [Aspergillus alliaceus]